VRRLTIKQVREEHGGILPNDAVFRPDDDEELAARAAAPSKPKRRTKSQRFAILNTFTDFGIAAGRLTGSEVKVLADLVPRHEGVRHRPCRASGHRPPGGNRRPRRPPRARETRSEGVRSRRSTGPIERGTIDLSGASDRHRMRVQMTACKRVILCPELRALVPSIPE